MLRELDIFYENKEEPNRSCLLALRTIILTQDSLVNETRKWGMPCFCYQKKMFCYLWTDKKTKKPYLLMVEGQHLDHSLLEQGDRKRMKILRIDPTADLPIVMIHEILKKALDLYRDGIVKT